MLRLLLLSAFLASSALAQDMGDLTLNGVTKPVMLLATHNGGWGHMPLDPGGARAGFLLEGTLMRSDFGITNGIPAPGTKMGVSDEVRIFIETELINPDAPKP